MKSKNSKIICINKFIKEDLKLESENNVTVLENGYEQDIFSKSNKKDEKIKIIFSGNLQRFGKSRGVEEIVDYFINSKFYINAELHIFGGPPEYSQNLKQKYKNQNC